MHGCHLHLSVADSKGLVYGGHLVENNLIYTTCELVLVELQGFEFKRAFDPKTNYNELVTYLMKS